ncbi:High molecular weight rubredoxin [Caprobacter fermentans]|uniref:High molecular weight rubredoxin n=2 Tax=Caproicibacter fermentans TaxID=2576756 RepID=A0A6N8I4H5_9FIRM|nr:flavin reductase [Caproicibacter fermentans]MVB12869.1 High molecular weight rubredoxin [Caproicibacter fermentans]
MNDVILNSLSYGMYAIGVKDGEKKSACIANTVIQVANTPNIIAVSLNHDNYSCRCIQRNGLFTVSVLSEDTSGAVIGALGFSSGRDTDKLKNVRHRVLAEGIPVIKENTCCWFLCRVLTSSETATHTVFLAEVIAGSEKAVGKPMTYEYYHRVIKGRAPKNAPTYREEKQTAQEQGGESWICTVCGYVYSDPFVPFEELPDDWVCPICGAPKSAFKRQQ